MHGLGGPARIECCEADRRVGHDTLGFELVFVSVIGHGRPVLLPHRNAPRDAGEADEMVATGTEGRGNDLGLAVRHYRMMSQKISART